MTQWLAEGRRPDHFTIDRDCELRNRRRANRGSLRAAQPRQRRSARTAAASQPAWLTWRDRDPFVLTDQLQVKRGLPSTC